MRKDVLTTEAKYLPSNRSMQNPMPIPQAAIENQFNVAYDMQ